MSQAWILTECVQKMSCLILKSSGIQDTQELCHVATRQRVQFMMSMHYLYITSFLALLLLSIQDLLVVLACSDWRTR